jgi:putative membrane protein
LSIKNPHKLALAGEATSDFKAQGHTDSRRLDEVIYLIVEEVKCYTQAMKLIFNWLVSAIAVAIAAYVLPGVSVDTVVSALITAVVLGGINLLIRPVILFLTLPINILTLGLFTLVINAVLVLLASAVVPGFQVASFWWALLFSIVLTIVNSVLHRLSK